MGFGKWLGSEEGRSVRYPMIWIAMAALAAFVLYLLPKGEGAGRRFDEGWVIVRPCGGPMLKRDPEGRYWKVDGNSTWNL